jgi:phage gp36-like protein
MYVTVAEVRQRLKLLSASSITDSEIQRFIVDAESYINLCLADLYQVPVRKSSNLDGTISLTAGSPTITGLGTSFLTDLEIKPFDHIRVNKTGELLLISSVTSDTVATATENAAKSTTDSTFFIIPEEICTVTRYYTVKLILDWQFSEQSFNQETDKAVSRYEDIAMRILKKIEKGTYYNADLIAQASSKNKARAIGLYQGTLQENNLAVQSEYNSWWDS